MALVYVTITSYHAAVILDLAFYPRTSNVSTAPDGGKRHLYGEALFNCTIEYGKPLINGSCS